MCAVYPYFVVFFIYFELDPLIQIYKYWIPPNKVKNFGIWFKISFHLFRFVQILPAQQAGHLISVIICLSTVAAHAVLSCVTFFVKTAAQISNPIREAQILCKHKGLEIILLMGTDITRFAIGGFMLLGAIISVGVNFISIKMLHLIPMPLNLTFPTVAVITPCLFSVMLPMLTDLYEMDRKVHSDWNYYLSRSPELKLLKRKLRATKVIRYYAGIFGFTVYQLKRKVKSECYFAIANYTITALLYIDPLVFQKKVLKV